MMNYETDFLAYQLLNIYKGRKVLDFFTEPLFGDASGRSYVRISFENLFSLKSLTALCLFLG